MFDELTGLGYGLVVFAIIIGVGTVVLFNFSGATSNCSSIAACGEGLGVWNGTGAQCYNATDACGVPTDNGYLNTQYLMTQLGSGGLAGWAPAIIAISVGILFLGVFMVRGSGKGRY